MRRNGIIAIILCLTMILCNAGLVFADTINKTAIKSVNVNGKALTIDSENYFFLDEANRTMAPIRLLCENLGGTVSWDKDTQRATVVKNNKTVQITIGQKLIKVNGKETTIDTTAKLVNGKTFLPLRAISETLGFYVSATGSTKTGMIVFITTEKPVTPTGAINNTTLVIKPLEELPALNKAIADNGCSVESNSHFGPFTISGLKYGGFNFWKETRGYQVRAYIGCEDKQLNIINAFFNEVLPPELANELTTFTKDLNIKMKTLSGAEWTAYYNTIKDQKTINYNGITVIRSIWGEGMDFEIYK